MTEREALEWLQAYDAQLGFRSTGGIEGAAQRGGCRVTAFGWTVQELAERLRDLLIPKSETIDGLRRERDIARRALEIYSFEPRKVEELLDLWPERFVYTSSTWPAAAYAIAEDELG